MPSASRHFPLAKLGTAQVAQAARALFKKVDERVSRLRAPIRRVCPGMKVHTIIDNAIALFIMMNERISGLRAPVRGVRLETNVDTIVDNTSVHNDERKGF